MTTALLLARSGKKVAIVEQASTLAPTINGFVRKGAYFDTGFHYAAMMGKDEMVYKLCDHLNILQHIKLSQPDDSMGDLLIHPPTGLRFSFGESLTAFRENLLKEFPADSVNIIKYLDEIQNYITRVNTKLLDAVITEVPFFEDGHFSLADYLDSRFSSNILKMILGVHFVLYGSAPSETSMQYHSMIAGGYYHQVQQVYNGGKALTDAYAAELNSAGIDTFFNAEVSSIIVNETRDINGVELVSGEKLEANEVIYSGHPGLIIDMLPDGVFRPAYSNRLKRLENTFSAFTIYCIDNCDSNALLDHNNVILCNNAVAEPLWEDIENGPVFISKSLSDTHNGGVSLICPAVNTGHSSKWLDSKSFSRPDDYYQWKQHTADRILNGVKTQCPELANGFEIVDIASDLTFRDYMNAPDGCLYGVKHLVSDMHLLPRTKLKGLYLTGQATVTSGLAGTLLSGYITAMEVTGEDYRKMMH